MKGFLVILYCIAYLFSWFHQVKGQGNQTVSNGGLSAPAIFPGTGCIYSWVNSNPAIGLAPSGVGNIPSFTGVNRGTIPIIGTITATATTGGLAYVANAQSSSISVINVLTNTVTATIPLSFNPFSVAVSVDGSKLYVTNFWAGTVSVINAATYTVIATISVGMYPWALYVNPNGSYVYVANNNIASNTVTVISTTTNTAVSSITVGLAQGVITSNANGSLLYVSNTNSNTVSVINAVTNTVVATIPVGSGPWGLALSPDDSKLYVVNNGSNSVSVVNTTTNTVISTIPVGSEPWTVSVTPDGSRAYVSDFLDNTVSVINTATYMDVATIPVDVNPWAVQVTPDGSKLYVTNLYSGTVSVISTTTNLVTSTISVGNAPQAIAIFNQASTGCSSTPVTFTITVNPSPQIILPGGVSGSISTCAGTPSEAPDILQFEVAGNYLTGDFTIAAPVGFEVSLSSGFGYSSSITLIQVGGTVSNTVVYVRSSATAPPGNSKGDIVVSSPGAASLLVAVSGTAVSLPPASVNVMASANPVCSATAVTFTAKPTNGGETPTYQWTLDGSPRGGNSSTFTDSTARDGDIIYCTMTTNTTCPVTVSSSPVNLIVDPLPTVTFDPDTVVIPGNSGVQLAPMITGSIVQYQWTPAFGLNAANIANPVASPPNSVIYQLSVTDGHGCNATGKVVVITDPNLTMPNAFTPNGDGHNDVFRIPAAVPISLEEMDIFDRMGVRVYTTRDIGKSWDGTYNGQPAPSGAYIYLVKGKTFSGKPTVLKGIVMLIR
ncbi:MAG TPA: gliding motility-associated C-terminal domain-containing protein [Puia sp.]|uniref:T9SS type B sorting domain-containing protein n=1 Tax=Puia sp. TaxID=2045100 RepID=UPI002C1B625E|nr:gliding motility-associated C-terminal domain-containing protein [Puia sp.]HVU95453.1 gliding motility-associated C-terminal domain-containing protein [Puia sp.]